jgi:hypothetical protein
MKTMSCKQLGGACNKLFSADTFDEIAMMSQNHGKKMFEKGGEEHLKAMGKMSEIMQNPEAMQNWLDVKRKEFDSLPED